MSPRGERLVLGSMSRRQRHQSSRLVTLAVACVLAVLSGFLYAPPASAATAPAVTSPGNQFSGVGIAVSLQLAATGGTAPYQFSATGLPAGLAITPTGLIAGTATTAGTYTTKVTATDALNATSAAVSFTWTTGTAPVVAALAAPGTRASTLNTAVSGITHSATGATTPYTWSATGLPTGLSISSSTGAVTGTPTVGGTYAVKVTATSAAKIPSAPLSYTWNVASALAFTAPATQQGTVGQATSLTLTASGGASPYTWTVTGLPAGLTATTDGTISGTPTTAATSTVSATVKDSFGRSLNRTFSWVVAVGPTVNAPATQNSTTGTAITSLTVTAAAGKTPYTWTATGLPTGLTMTTGGVISGTPTVAGTFTVTVTAKDSTGRTGSKTFTWNVAAPLSFTAPATQQGTVGQSSTLTLAATGGSAPYTWTVTGLPAGLTATTDGTISGTPTTAATSTVSATVKDSFGRSLNRTFSWVVAVGPAVNAPATQTSTTGTAIPSLTVTASGGTAPYTYTISDLPAGLTMSTTGVISGTPTVAGTFTVTVTAKDSTGRTGSKTFTWNVAAPLSFTAPATQQGTVGQSSTLTLTASGGSSPYTWTVTGLPGGLTATTDGLISGSPAALGTFTVTATAKDTAGRSLSRTFDWVVAAPLSAADPGAQTGTVGVTTSLALTATGGTSPYTWSVGGLPVGLTVSTTGIISGVPTTASSTTVTATVTDAIGRTSRVTFAFDVKGPVVVTNPGAQDGTVGSPSALALAAVGGTGSYAWSALGLPDGLTLDAATGLISGTPRTAATWAVTVTATDTALRSNKLSFDWTIASPLLMTDPGAQSGTVGIATALALAATGGTGPYTWTATGLPAGLTIDPVTGAITGILSMGGASTVTVKVTDTAGRIATASFPWKVGEPVAIAVIANQNATVGVAATLTATADGGTAPYTWSAVGLPDGLAINSTTGVITGTPTTTATWSVTLRATDKQGLTATTTFTWDVRTAPAIAAQGAQGSDAGQASQLVLTATGGAAPYAWSATGLPPGLSIAADTGIISGTGTRAGIYRATITVTDAAGRTNTKGLDWKIYAAATSSPVMSAGKGVRLGSDMPTGAHLGAAVVGDYAFTTAGNQIIKTNTSTGTSTVLAGTTASTSCATADTGAAARFSSPKVIGADGSVLYVSACSGSVYAVNPGSGATAVLAGSPSATVYIVSGHLLYGLNGSYLYQYDLQTGVNTLIASGFTNTNYRALGADDTAVWLTNDRTITRWDLATRTSSTPTTTGLLMTGPMV
ncbi:beta strand repeat-containing protein, partial [Actinoplanes sp. NPDC049681]|uniref:beta strand repeat-containing protein n=1 Tax=Actinoplanes sp. NPDC049681 TaxID=3363905 RepID=UPI0037B31A84